MIQDCEHETASYIHELSLDLLSISALFYSIVISVVMYWWWYRVECM